MKRRLIKFSNYSYCITLPKQAVSLFGWKKGEELTIDFDEKTRQILVGKKGGKRTPKESISKTKAGIKPVPPLKW